MSLTRHPPSALYSPGDMVRTPIVRKTSSFISIRTAVLPRKTRTAASHSGRGPPLAGPGPKTGAPRTAGAPPPRSRRIFFAWVLHRVNVFLMMVVVVSSKPPGSAGERDDSPRTVQGRKAGADQSLSRGSSPIPEGICPPLNRRPCPCAPTHTPLAPMVLRSSKSW